MTRNRIAITGSGSLAFALLRALTHAANWPLDIVIASRPSKRLVTLAGSMRAIAGVSQGSTQVAFTPVDWSDHVSLSRTLREIRADVIVHTASLQSAWSLGGTDGWSRLVAESGYGVTLPLQLQLANRLCAALLRSSGSTILINACYPDAVNAMLAPSTPNLLCGIGNVSTLGAFMAPDLCLAGETLRLVGHHAHLSAAISGGEVCPPVLAWRDLQPIDAAAEAWMRRAQIPSDETLNAVTAAAIVPVIASWLGRAAPTYANLPGVFGWLGGYPIRIAERAIVLDLPPSVDSVSAIQHNRAASEADGVTVDNGVANFTLATRDALSRVAPGAALSAPFGLEDIERVAANFVHLREQLRLS